MDAPQIKYSALEAMALIASKTRPEHGHKVFSQAANILGKKPDYCSEEIDVFIELVIPALADLAQAEEDAGEAACHVAMTISKLEKARAAHYIDIDLRQGGQA